MQKERYIGIDYLRAFFSVFVVLAHLGYVLPSMIFNKNTYLEHIFTLSDIINFYLLLLAVPVFLLTSNYLFVRKQRDNSALFTYLKRIGKIVLLWIVLFAIFKYQGWQVINWLPKSPKELVFFIFSGGHTIYYFFISLIALTTIAHFSKRLNILYVLALFIITTLFVSILPILSITTGNFLLSVFWSPLNFLPYPFGAILLLYIVRLDKNKIKPIYMILVGFLILILAFLDWTIYVNKGFFGVNLYAIPAYARPSLVFIAMVVLYFAIKANPRRNPVIMFMSNNSLALYCLHPFFLSPARDLSGGNLFISLLLVLTFSYLTGIIIKQFIREKLI